MWHLLRRDGVQVARCTVERLMRRAPAVQDLCIDQSSRLGRVLRQSVISDQDASHAVEYLDQRRAVRGVLPWLSDESLDVDVQDPSQIQQHGETVNRADAALHLRKPRLRPTNQTSDRDLTHTATATIRCPIVAVETVHLVCLVN